LARQNPGKSVSSDNTCSLPPVPTNPSRVDRLVIDSLREHARVSVVVCRCCWMLCLMAEFVTLVNAEFVMRCFSAATLCT